MTSEAPTRADDAKQAEIVVARFESGDAMLCVLSNGAIRLERGGLCITKTIAEWQLTVPRELTDDMLTAGCDAFLARNEDRFAIFADDIRAVWEACYDAAPKAAQQPPAPLLCGCLADDTDVECATRRNFFGNRCSCKCHARKP